MGEVSDRWTTNPSRRPRVLRQRLSGGSTLPSPRASIPRIANGLSITGIGEYDVGPVFYVGMPAVERSSDGGCHDPHVAAAREG